MINPIPHPSVLADREPGVGQRRIRGYGGCGGIGGDAPAQTAVFVTTTAIDAVPRATGPPLGAEVQSVGITAASPALTVVSLAFGV